MPGLEVDPEVLVEASAQDTVPLMGGQQRSEPALMLRRGAGAFPGGSPMLARLNIRIAQTPSPNSAKRAKASLLVDNGPGIPQIG